MNMYNLSQNHPEDGNDMPLEEMERQLALTGNTNAYHELEDELKSVYEDETDRMRLEAANVIGSIVSTGDDDSVYDFAGFDRRRSSAQRVLDSDMLKPSTLTGPVAEAAKGMSPGQLGHLRQEAVRFAMHKMDIDDHPSHSSLEFLII